MPEEPITIALDVTVTLDDQLRFTEWLLDRPALRWKRFALRAAVVVLAPLLGVLLGVMLACLQDGTAFGPAIAAAFSDKGSLRIIAVVAGLLAAGYAALRLLRRPLLRRRLRRLLRERVGIDAADTALTERAHLTLGPDGFVSQTEAVTVKAGWASVKGLDDEGQILVLKTGRWSGYLIPKRCLSQDEVVQVRRMVERRGAGARPVL